MKLARRVFRQRVQTDDEMHRFRQMQEERDLETKAMSEELDKRDEEIQRLELLLFLGRLE